MALHYVTSCETCEGTGWYDEDPCPDCGGTGEVPAGDPGPDTIAEWNGDV